MFHNGLPENHVQNIKEEQRVQHKLQQGEDKTEKKEGQLALKKKLLNLSPSKSSDRHPLH